MPLVALADALAAGVACAARSACAAEALRALRHARGGFGSAAALLPLAAARAITALMAACALARSQNTGATVVTLLGASVCLAQCGALGVSVASAVATIVRVERHDVFDPDCDGFELALAVLSLALGTAHAAAAVPAAVDALCGRGSRFDSLSQEGSDNNQGVDFGLAAVALEDAEAGAAARAAVGVARESRSKTSAALRRLAALARPEVGLLAAGMVMLLLAQGAGLALPLAFGRVIDTVASGTTESHTSAVRQLNHDVLALALIVIVSAAATAVRAYCFNYAGQRVVARLRHTLFGAIIRQEVSFFDETKTGDLISRLSSDTETLQDAATANVSMLVRYLVQIVGSLILMAYSSWRLTLLVISSVPLIAISMVVFGRWIRSFRKAFQDQLAMAAAKADEAISNVRTVKAFAAERAVSTEYLAHIRTTLRLGRSMTVAGAGFQGLVSFASFGTLVLVLAYGGRLVLSDELTAGALSSFLLYSVQIAGSFGFLAGLFVSFAQAIGASERVFSLIARASSMGADRAAALIPLSEFRGAVTLHNVTFAYPSRPEVTVLNGVSLRAGAGEVLALVGASGSGKSTVVRMLLRFYDPTEGAVLLDGHDIRGLSLDWLRQHVFGLVSQEPVLFSGTIRDNILFGMPGASDGEVEAAARAANAEVFIRALPKGYDTEVGEGGTQLSGGQKQRVAIARAIIKSPRVLLLDEATSALDAESEALVQQALETLQKGRTSIVVAHRLATIVAAQSIAVFAKGELKERGSHAELMRDERSVYSSLVRKQMISESFDAVDSETSADVAARGGSAGSATW